MRYHEYPFPSPPPPSTIAVEDASVGRIVNTGHGGAIPVGAVQESHLPQPTVQSVHGG